MAKKGEITLVIRGETSDISRKITSVKSEIKDLTMPKTNGSTSLLDAILPQSSVTAFRQNVFQSKAAINEIIKEDERAAKSIIGNYIKAGQAANKFNQDKSNAAKRAADAEIKAFKEVQAINNQTRANAERNEKLLEQSARSLANVRAKEAKRAANDFLTSFKDIEKGAASSAAKTQNIFAAAFSGSFLGSVGANIVSGITNQLSQLPGIVRTYLDQAAKASSDQANAFKGLDSAAIFKGIDAKAAQDAVKNLRLVKAGIIDTGDGATALKNLLGAGFGLKESNELIERFSDAAAFGKQSALGYGEAIRGATEGVKNQNSALVDNAGVTKNLSVILKERGFQLEDLSDKVKGASAREALYKGLLGETAAQVGDADKLTQGYAGTVAALDNAQTKLSITVGDIITQNPEYIALLQTSKQGVDSLTVGLLENQNQSRTTFASLISDASRAAVQVPAYFEYIVTRGKTFFAALAATGTLYVLGVTKTIEAIFQPAVDLINLAIDGVNLIKNNPIFAAIVPAAAPLVGTPNLERFAPLNLGSQQAYADLQNLVSIIDSTRGAEQRLAEQRKLSTDIFDANLKVVKENQSAVQSLTKAQKAAGEELSAVAKKAPKSEITAAKRMADGLTEKAPSVRATQVLNNVLAPSKFDAQIGQAATRVANETGIELKTIFTLIKATLFRESSGRANLTSEKNAQGYFQILPETQRALGVRNPNDFSDAAYGAGKYLAQGFARGGAPEAFAQYFAGPGGGNRGVKTRDYVGAQTYVFRQAGKRGGLSESDITNIEKNAVTADNELFEKQQFGNQLSLLQSAGARLSAETKKDLLAFLNKNLSDRQKFSVEELSAELERRNPGFGLVETDLTSQRKRFAPLKGDAAYLERLKEENGLLGENKDLIIERATIDKAISIVVDGRAKAIQIEAQNLNIQYGAILRRNLADETGVELLRQRNAQSEDLFNATRDIEVLRKQNADAAFVSERRRLDTTGELRDLEREITQLKDQQINFAVNSGSRVAVAFERDKLDLLRQEEDAIISINRSQLELNNSRILSENQVHAKVLEHLSQQKTLNESISDGIIAAYERVANFLDKQIDKTLGKLPVIGDFFAEIAKAQSRSVLTNITTKILGIDLDAQKNPVVDRINTTNKLLSQINANVSGGVNATNTANVTVNAAASALSGTGGIGGIIQSALGGLARFLGIGGRGTSGSSLGGFGGGTINLGSNNAGINAFINGSGIGGGLHEAGNSIGASSRGGVSQLLGRGGIFGSEGFGANVGTFGAIGTGANLLGGLIGGRVGGFLSGAGSGLALGAQIGSIIPGVGTVVGAAVGAIAGGLISLFGGDPKRKKDKNENIPALNKGFAESLDQMRKIVAQVKGVNLGNALNFNESDVLSQVAELRKNIASGYGINFESKKYRKEAQKLIQSNLSQFDSLNAELSVAIAAAREKFEIAGVAGERTKRILPEFAGGTYLSSSFLRRNGLLYGGQAGRDSLPSLLMPGEMVLNNRQLADIKRGAGYDVFAAHTSIPHYEPKQNYSAPVQMAGGGFVASAPAGNQPPTIIVNATVINQIDVFGVIKTYIQTDDGKRYLAKTVNELKTTGEIS